MKALDPTDDLATAKADAAISRAGLIAAIGGTDLKEVVEATYRHAASLANLERIEGLRRVAEAKGSCQCSKCTGERAAEAS